MSRVATTSHPSSRSQAGAQLAQAYSRPSGSQQQMYRQPARVPKYTTDYRVNGQGKEEEVLTLDDDEEDDSPQPHAGPSHHPNYNQPQVAQQTLQPNPFKRRSGVIANGAYGSHYANHQQGEYALPTVNGAQRKRKAEHDAGYSNDAVSEADKEGHYIVQQGNTLKNSISGVQYRIEAQLGMGTFGKVVKARTIYPDGTEGPMVAVKVIRAVTKYIEAAKVEVNVLKTITDLDKKMQEKRARHRFYFNRWSHCIHILSTFDYKRHTCIVTELLGVSVFDFLKSTGYQPFSFKHIQSFARQLLDSISFLHAKQITHTDLKPENILLVNDKSETVKDANGKVKKRLVDSTIRLIDFGSATRESEYHATVVSTRHYRAPEIILGLGWSHECDVWSVGCILVEFFTGEALFQTHENIEHLAMMQKVFGPMPSDYAYDAYRKADQKNKNWFVERRNERNVPAIGLNFPEKADSKMAVQLKQSVKFVNKMETLEKKLLNVSAADLPVAKRFLELVKGLLRWRKLDRFTAQEALESAFCQEHIP